MGFTQEKFAEISGLSRQTISQVEREKQAPSWDTIVAYGTHTEHSVDWLVLAKKYPSKNPAPEPMTRERAIEMLRVATDFLASEPTEQPIRKRESSKNKAAETMAKARKRNPADEQSEGA